MPGIPAKTVHFPPWLAGLPAPQTPLAALVVSTPRGKCREFPRFWCTSPRGMRLSGRSSKACLVKCLVYRHFKKELLLDLGWNGGFVAKSGQSSKSPKCMRLTISAIHLGSVLDTVKVLKSIYPFAKRLSPPWLVWAPVPQTSLTALVVSSRRMPMKTQQSKRPGPPIASRRAPPSRAEGG